MANFSSRNDLERFVRARGKVTIMMLAASGLLDARERELYNQWEAEEQAERDALEKHEDRERARKAHAANLIAAEATLRQAIAGASQAAVAREALAWSKWAFGISVVAILVSVAQWFKSEPGAPAPMQQASAGPDASAMALPVVAVGASSPAPGPSR